MSVYERYMEMTSSEINADIFANREPWEPVGLTQEQAAAIIDHPCYESLDRNLVDWAWNTIED